MRLMPNCHAPVVKGWKRISLILWLLCSLATRGASQEQLREKYWREDLEEVRQKLPKLHKDLFHKLPREKFQSELSALEKAVPTLKDSEVIVALMRLIASVGDPHTQVDSDTAGFHDYPLELLWFPDRFPVIATLRTHRSIPGANLVQIGDVPIGLAMQRVVPVFPRVNLPGVQADITDYLTTPEVLFAQKIVPSEHRARFIFEDPSGKKVAVQLSALGAHERPAWISVPSKALQHKHSDLYYWYEYLPDSKTLYFNYSRCREMKQQPFREFNQKIFEFIDAHAVDRWVVDLRGNGGGDSEVIEPFVKEVVKRQSINQDGHLFVLIGRSTYSSGVMAAYRFVTDTEALFIGGPPGGKPQFFCGGESV